MIASDAPQSKSGGLPLAVASTPTAAPNGTLAPAGVPRHPVSYVGVAGRVNVVRAGAPAPVRRVRRLTLVAPRGAPPEVATADYQLAYSILLNYTGDRDLALRLYRGFRSNVLRHLIARAYWTLEHSKIDAYLAKRKADPAATA